MKPKKPQSSPEYKHITLDVADPVRLHVSIPNDTKVIVNPSCSLDSLNYHFNRDEGYAWSWQSNIAVPIADALFNLIKEGKLSTVLAQSHLRHRWSNEVAAILMKHLFDVDMGSNSLYMGVLQKVAAIELDEVNNIGEWSDVIGRNNSNLLMTANLDESDRSILGIAENPNKLVCAEGSVAITTGRVSMAEPIKGVLEVILEQEANISTLRDVINRMSQALKVAEGKFRYYASYHTAKGTEDSLVKAQDNVKMADAMAQARGGIEPTPPQFRLDPTLESYPCSPYVEPQEGEPKTTGYEHDGEILERLFWEFDDKRKGGGERLDFKNALRSYANSFYVAPETLHRAEAAECAHKALDDLGVPRVTASGLEYSLVGRIEFYKTQGAPVAKYPPNTATITVQGATQVGKTIVSHKIARMLEDEYGATVVRSGSMKQDSAGSKGYILADWEIGMVGNTTWSIVEEGK